MYCDRLPSNSDFVFLGCSDATQLAQFFFYVFCRHTASAPITTNLVAGKTGECKKLENLLQNRTIGSIVGARPTAAPRHGKRENVEGIMTT